MTNGRSGLYTWQVHTAVFQAQEPFLYFSFLLLRRCLWRCSSGFRWLFSHMFWLINQRNRLTFWSRVKLWICPEVFKVQHVPTCSCVVWCRWKSSKHKEKRIFKTEAKNGQDTRSIFNIIPLVCSNVGFALLTSHFSYIPYSFLCLVKYIDWYSQSCSFKPCVWSFRVKFGISAQGQRRRQRCSSEWALKVRKRASWIPVPISQAIRQWVTQWVTSHWCIGQAFRRPEGLLLEGALRISLVPVRSQLSSIKLNGQRYGKVIVSVGIHSFRRKWSIHEILHIYYI